MTPQLYLMTLWRGLITIRWTLWLSLLLVLAFALATGYHFGTAYIDGLLAR